MFVKHVYEKDSSFIHMIQRTRICHSRTMLINSPSGDLQVYTQSQKKCTMNSLASPVTQGQGQVTPARSKLT